MNIGNRVDFQSCYIPQYRPTHHKHLRYHSVPSLFQVVNKRKHNGTLQSKACKASICILPQFIPKCCTLNKTIFIQIKISAQGLL